MKRLVSVLLMRENVRCRNGTLRAILNAIIFSIWLAAFLLLMIGILSIYEVLT